MMILILFFILLIFELNAKDILVNIPNGTIKGRLEYSLRNNVTFYAFNQIPFAKPPVGELRFRKPYPADPWVGTLDASSPIAKNCLQVATWGNFGNQTEDCLYLNVYTPKFPSCHDAYPVMFFLYGGLYNSGSSGFYFGGPHWLIEKNVVIVTAFYRVGPFGFLSTGDNIIPGNYGLKDQNLALKWTKENIKYFGGDPNKVTIMGSSAGGASVTFHLMSPKSKGLFRAAISHSGSLLSPWTYQQQARSFAYRLATSINSSFNPNSTSEELLWFLRNSTAYQINSAAQTIVDTIGNEQLVQGAFWGPVIEPVHENAFITKSMYEAVENGEMSQVPLLIGINSEEALDRSLSSIFATNVSAYDANVSALVGRDMNVNDASLLETVGNEIRKIYTDGLFQNRLGDAVRYFSDISFTKPVIRHAYLQSKYSDVYFYQFSYNGKLGRIRPYVPGAERIAHGVEGNYVWCYFNASNLDAYPTEDVLTSERFRTLLTNFAKYLNPTPELSDLLQNTIWPTVKQGNFKYLNINNTLRVQTDPKNGTYPKWVKLYEDYGTKPFITF